MVGGILVETSQTSTPQKFDVVSIRAVGASPASAGRGGGGGPNGGQMRAPLSASACALDLIQRDPGRLTMRNSTVVRIITTAYGQNCEVASQEGLLSGLPDWALWQKFDLQATYPTGTSDTSRQAMLQYMLAERFQLKLHRSSKDVALFNLVATPTLKLKQSDDQTTPAPARQLPSEGLVMQINNLTLNILKTGKGTISATSMPIATLLQATPLIN